MFTGIIKKISKIQKVTLKKGSLFVVLEKPRGWRLGKGNSILINGVCTTVRHLFPKSFEVEWMPETIEKTTVGGFYKGTAVNLERSMKLGDLFDGHIIQGHVDSVGKVIGIKRQGKMQRVKFQVSKKFMKFITPKGSIAVDGVSLTVVETGTSWFSVALVSYTLEHTSLKTLKIGDKVNIEVDVLARYIERFTKSFYATRTNKKYTTKN